MLGSSVCSTLADSNLCKAPEALIRLNMCRNIKTLYNFEPPATDAEIRAAAVQFVRKLSGFNKPSRANVVAFDRAVDAVAEAAGELLASLETRAAPRNRDAEASKARARAAKRFGSAPVAR